MLSELHPLASRRGRGRTHLQEGSLLTDCGVLVQELASAVSFSQDIYPQLNVRMISHFEAMPHNNNTMLVSTSASHNDQQIIVGLTEQGTLEVYICQSMKRMQVSTNEHLSGWQQCKAVVAQGDSGFTLQTRLRHEQQYVELSASNSEELLHKKLAFACAEIGKANTLTSGEALEDLKILHRIFTTRA